MKTRIFFAFTSFLFSAFTYSQNCKVLLTSISGTYEGECRSDKANGAGKSIGLDTYEGNFKNGYPEGQGKYIWKDGNWYDGSFKLGQRTGYGTLHYKREDKPDSSLAGYWSKDKYIGIYEYPYKVQSTSYMVKSATVSAGDKSDPPQIIILLSSVTGGSVDLHGSIPKPTLTGIDIKNGSYINKQEVTSLEKTNMYTLTNVIFPFSAVFRIGGDDVAVDFNNAGSWTLTVVLRQ
jgi:hypothetical protein